MSSGASAWPPGAPGACAAWLLIAVLGVGLPARGQSPASQPITWPGRRTRGLDRLARHVPPTLRLPPGEGHKRAATLRVRRCEPAGLGLVLEIEPPPGGRKSPAETMHMVFVSFPPAPPADARGGQGKDGGDGAKAAVPETLGARDVELGVRWTLYEPARTPRGLVVHLGGNRYVRRALRKAGWVVLSSDGTGRYFARRRRPQVFTLRGAAEAPAVARRIAAAIDDELADWPYSLEAVLDYLARHRPDLPQEPAAIMGFSIGALGLPAVVARRPECFRAAVIVAGGADLLRIAATSHKPNPGIVLRRAGGALDKELWTVLDREYLRHATLDPYNAAAALRGRRVLFVSGHFDQVVPAACGDLLYERLGRPERWSYPVGHRQLLRTIMRFQAGRLADWTRNALTQ